MDLGTTHIRVEKAATKITQLTLIPFIPNSLVLINPLLEKSMLPSGIQFIDQSISYREYGIP
jgi:hypothetical protein